MALSSFSQVLAFAEAVETAFGETLDRLLPEADMLAPVFAKLRKQAARNARQAETWRRENVTELIMEPVVGLDEADYPAPATEGSPRAEVVGHLERLLAFYDRAEGAMIVAEVARGLAALAKRYRKLAAPLGVS